MAIHGMLRYAYHHGVKVLFLENPETLGYLKKLWVRKGGEEATTTIIESKSLEVG